MKVVATSGTEVFLWFDNWLDQGKIIDITGEAGTIHFGIPRNARVSDVVNDGRWSIHGRNRLFPALHRLISEAPVPLIENSLDLRL